MIIKNGQIYTKEHEFHTGMLYIEGDKISCITTDLRQEEAVENKELEVKKNGEETFDATDCYVIPGLIDIHFHGCMGADFCDGTKEALKTIAKYELSQGVTSICPASMTYPEETLTRVFANASDFVCEDGATLVGINMEGPFISKEKKGAQNEAYIQAPDARMFERLQEAAGGKIKLLDIAPEVEGARELIKELADKVRISIAHSAADYDIAKEAFELGVSHVTHLHNGMTNYHYRAPGVVGASCDKESVMVEVICDGVHIHPAVIRNTLKMFGEERVIFISDSIRACGLGDGDYMLGGQAVKVKGNHAVLENGTIAGSVISLMDGLRKVVKEMDIPLESVVRCMTENPAKAIGICKTCGSLEAGKNADVLILDKNLEIVHIIKAGKMI